LFGGTEELNREVARARRSEAQHLCGEVGEIGMMYHGLQESNDI
jgi:hypothetical protein